MKKMSIYDGMFMLWTFVGSLIWIYLLLFERFMDFHYLLGYLFGAIGMIITARGFD